MQTLFSPSIRDMKTKHMLQNKLRGGLSTARKWKSKDPKVETVKSLMYGVLIAMIIVPVNISFSAIIFSDGFYSPHLPGLTKLVLAAGTIHQLCFTMRSSLPFAIGQVGLWLHAGCSCVLPEQPSLIFRALQVQDAGLIFLSAMASHIAAQLKEEVPDDEVLSACVCTLALGTSMLGVALVCTVRRVDTRTKFHLTCSTSCTIAVLPLRRAASSLPTTYSTCPWGSFRVTTPSSAITASSPD